MSIELKDLVGTTILQGCEWGKADLARRRSFAAIARAVMRERGL